MTDRTGLSDTEIENRLKSGNYILEGEGKNRHLVAVGVSSIYEIVAVAGMSYELDLWFKCWRASKYGIPKTKYMDHAFRGAYICSADESDELIEKITSRKNVYNDWIRRCARQNIRHNDFEWLFVGDARTPLDMHHRIGQSSDIRRLIIGCLEVFKTANE